MVTRMIRAARLDVNLYEEVEANPSLTRQAITVVVIIALLNVIGNMVGMLLDARPVGTAVYVALSNGLWSLVAFFIWAWLTYFVGTRFFNGTADYGELVRTLGYAYTPNILAAVRFIPCIGDLLWVIGALWSLVATTVAIRQALDFTTVKAILTVIVGFIVYVVGLAAIAYIYVSVSPS